MEFQVARSPVSARSNLLSYFLIASFVLFIINSVWTEKSDIDTDIERKLDSLIKHVSSAPPPSPPVAVEKRIYSDDDISNIIKDIRSVNIKNKELELKINKLQKLYLEQN